MIKFLKDKCIACGLCVDLCPTAALRLRADDVYLYPERCINCGICVLKCPFEAIKSNQPVTFGIRDVRYQVTRACNFRCPHCFSESGQKFNHELSLSEAKKICDKLIKNGMLTLTFTGGEPLLRKDFLLNLAEYLKNKGISVKLFTNGYFLTRPVINRLKNLVDEVQMSVDGGERHHNEWRGGSDSWARIWSAVSYLAGAGLTKTIRFTVTSANYRQLPEVMRKCETKGVDVLKVRTVINKGRAEKSPRYLLNQESHYAESVGKLVNLRRTKNYVIQLLVPSYGFIYDEYLKKNPPGGIFKGCVSCRMGLMVALLPDGELKACPYWPDKIGNLKTDSFSRVFNKLTEVVKPIIEIKKLAEPCAQCRYLTVCGGGCRANALNNNKSVNAPDPNCPLVINFIPPRRDKIYL
ncbi:MAG: radical SAM protein [Planctomycetota bacterium]